MIDALATHQQFLYIFHIQSKLHATGGSYYEKARSRRERHRLVLMQHQQTDNVIPLGRRGGGRGPGVTSDAAKEEEDDDDPGLRAIRKSPKLVPSRRLLSTTTKCRSAKPVASTGTSKRESKYKRSGTVAMKPTTKW
jgi:hypothetical protein